MDDQKLDRYLRSVGKRTFINCFELFYNNYNKLKEWDLGLLIPQYDQLSKENDPQNSLRRKASYAVGIFRASKELDALQMCVNAKKLDEQTKIKARIFLDKYSCFNRNENYQECIEKIDKNFTIKKPKEHIVKSISISNSNPYFRDPQIASYAKCLTNYTCEYNIKHTTFISELSGKQYVEAHHLIPMKFQKNFTQSLDVPENIIILCPNCHRAIHCGNKNLKNKMLKIFYNEKCKALKNKNIEISYDSLCEMY